MSQQRSMADLPLAPAIGAQAIARQLHDAIIGGAYNHRQQLPPERELAAHYRASRTTIRKALFWLETQKLVERRAGSGTFVSYEGKAAENNIAEVTSPLELIDVRTAIEPYMARLAVLHATARDLEKLDAWLKAMREAEKEDNAERFSTADEQFHLTLAASTSNPLMLWLYEHINLIRTHAQWAEMKRKIVNRANMADYNELHEAVVRAINARDAAAAAAAMTAHMEKARADLIGANSR